MATCTLSCKTFPIPFQWCITHVDTINRSITIDIWISWSATVLPKKIIRYLKVLFLREIIVYVHKTLTAHRTPLKCYVTEPFHKWQKRAYKWFGSLTPEFFLFEVGGYWTRAATGNAAVTEYHQITPKCNKLHHFTTPLDFLKRPRMLGARTREPLPLFTHSVPTLRQFSYTLDFV